MINVLAQPANNAGQFCGQTKGGKFKCEHFIKFCTGLLEIFGLHRFILSSFAIKVIQQTLAFTSLLRIETLHTLFAITVDLLQGEREGLQKGASHPVSGYSLLGPGRMKVTTISFSVIEPKIISVSQFLV